MGRKRFVSPEFFTHSELFDAERESGLPLRLAYAGLWTASDRRGMFWWKPREMKLALLPYDDVDFEAVLWALERHGFIECYVLDGKRFGRVPAMERWQSFHRNEQPSDVPEPSNGRRESSNGRLTPSPSVAVAVTTAVTTAVADTTETDSPSVADAPSVGLVLVPEHPKPKKDKKAKKPPAVGEAQFPNFPRATCDAMYAVWTTTFGAVDYGRFRKQFGPLFTLPEGQRRSDADLVAALKSYADLAPLGDGARFASVTRAAECLAAIATARHDHADDPATRSEVIMRILHGRKAS